MGASWRELAYEILKEEKKPLHYSEIAEKCLTKGKKTTGKTPDRTIYTELIRDPDRFTTLGGGLFSLVDWEERIESPERKDEMGIWRGTIQTINNVLEESRFRKMIIDELLEIDPREFEYLIAKLFEKMDYKAYVTEKSHDHSVDVVLWKEEAVLKQKTIVQVKRWTKNVGEPELRLLHSALEEDKTASEAFFVTTSSYTKIAINFANKKNVRLTLFDGITLVKLLLKYGLFT